MRFFTLIAFCALIQPVFAALPTEVRVKLFEAHPGMQTVRIEGSFQLIEPKAPQISSSQPYQIRTQNHQLVLSDRTTRKSILKTHRLVLKSTSPSGIHVQANQLAPRRYPGILVFSVEKNSLNIENRLPTRTYVNLVVASETQAHWPLEALKAQAVLTQTRLSRYQPGDALGDSTQHEAYLGLTHHRPEVDKAVASVWGQHLVYQGQPIQAFYHSSCAGQTSTGRLFNQRQLSPWLSSVACPYCKGAPFYKPTQRIIDTNAFSKIFSTGLPQILKHDDARRPLVIRLGNGQLVSGYAFWLKLGQRFGWDKAPGTRFDVKALPDGKIAISSTGAGHGVGLCQWGAATMARQGKTYQQILQFYFPKVQLAR